MLIFIGDCLDPKLHHRPVQSRPLSEHSSQQLDRKVKIILLLLKDNIVNFIIIITF